MTHNLTEHALSLEEMKQFILQEEIKCKEMISRESNDSSLISKTSCEPIWDKALCWPRSESNVLNKHSCPAYIPGFNSKQFATKYCNPNGTWFENNGSKWTNFSQCKNPAPPYPSIIQNSLPSIKMMSQIGYAVSLVSLVLALIILISIKRLRCPRNTLHMHLFVSFFLRAFMTILKSMLFVNGIGLPNSISFPTEEDGVAPFKTNHPNWECKLVVSFWQYALVANYFWILMEGLYLHNLIFLAPFSDSSAITLYVILGWGCPILVVSSWVLSRIYLDDTFCWTTHDSPDAPFKLFLIVQIPIIVSIVLNFFLFVNIIRVLLLKLQSAVSFETRKYRYRKWSKSTLVLVPLFGVHYFIFLGLTYYVNEDPVIEVIWLFADQFFASFQGCFVSLLYCLLNGEVRSELRKLWGTWRSSREDKSIPLYRISSKFRSTGGDNSPPNELTEEQQLNDVSCGEEKRKRAMSRSRAD